MPASPTLAWTAELVIVLVPTGSGADVLQDISAERASFVSHWYTSLISRITLLSLDVISMLHHQHSVHRCGILLQMSHVAWSVCELGIQLSCPNTAEQINTCVFLRNCIVHQVLTPEILQGRYVPAFCNVLPDKRIAQQTSAFTGTGEKLCKAMRYCAKLL